MKKVYVIFDGPPGPECGRFVEVEDERGKAVKSDSDWRWAPDEKVAMWRLGPFASHKELEELEQKLREVRTLALNLESRRDSNVAVVGEKISNLDDLIADWSSHSSGQMKAAASVALELKSVRSEIYRMRIARNEQCYTADLYKQERDDARKFGEEAARKYNELLENKVLTCAFCGEEYEKGTPPSQNEALTEHIKECKKHPIQKLKSTLEELEDSNWHACLSGDCPHSVGSECATALIHHVNNMVAMAAKALT